MKLLIQKYWKLLSGAVAAIIGLLYLRQYFQKDLKAQVLTRDVEIEAVERKMRMKEIQDRIDVLNGANEKEVVDRAKTQHELENMSPAEIAVYYKKQLKK